MQGSHSGGVHSGADLKGETGCKGNFNEAMLRVTSRGAIHALHYDVTDSVFFQVKGAKEVTMLPVMQLAYTYPFTGKDYRARRAQIDLRNPNLAKYPLSSQIKVVRITLHPGDMLLVPRRSAHETLALSESITLTYRLGLWCRSLHNSVTVNHRAHLAIE